ncbi:MAG: hypothetical protein ACREOO_25945 [bacterium]
MAKTSWHDLLSLLLLAACSSTPRGDIRFSIQPKRDDARLSVTAQGESALIDIFSASGIGGADLEITSPDLPRQILLRFHLRGLEELRFVYHDAVITASLSSTKEHQIHQSLNKVGATSTAARALASGDPQWLKIRIVPQAGAPAVLPLQQGYIEVEAPQSFITGAHRRMTIHWIDFYR